MNKLARQPYLALQEIFPGSPSIPPLCSFCKYALWTGDCCETEMNCEHPLLSCSWEFEMMVEGAYEGRDCWGFRPMVTFEVAHGMANNWSLGKDVLLSDDLKIGEKREKAMR